VRLIEDRLRVLVQLVDSENGFQVMSRTFDRDQRDFFRIQGDIANLIVGNLRLLLPPETQVVLTAADAYPDLEAYVLYRRGMEAYQRPRTTETIAEALDSFNRALAVDSEYAAAHAGICTTYASGFAVTSDVEFISTA